MEWSIALFSSRETSAILIASLKAAVAAAKGITATIDVIVNGNENLANDIINRIDAESDMSAVRVWYIGVADKANAWNQYVHNIWKPSDVTFFIDGYIQVLPDALKVINTGFDEAPHTLAATGVPSDGRSAKALREQMLREGGFHGNLFAIRGEVLQQIRAIGFYLPLGLYRTDALIGAVLSFGLDPAQNEWNLKRILVKANASWRVRTLDWRHFSDYRAAFKRIQRQAQGILENIAIREHLAIQKNTPQSLPKTASDLVISWLIVHRHDAIKIYIRHPLCLLAAFKLSRSRNKQLEPVLPRRILPRGKDVYNEI